MCRPHIRQCPICGFIRPFAWTNCKAWLSRQRYHVLLGERMPIPPSDCPKQKPAEDIWLFPYPSLQCGNEECPSLPEAEEVQAECYRVAAEKKRIKEEIERKKREELERKQAIFAKKWFRKIPVLSVPEQEKAWDEMMVEKEKAKAEVSAKKV